MRRMLNQVGLPPVRTWSAKYHASHTRAASSPRIHLGPGFHANASFWRLLVEGGLGLRRVASPPLCTVVSCSRPRLPCGRTPRAMPWVIFLGPEPGSGVWWRFEFDDDVRARLRATVRDWNDLSINVLELLGMVVTAWIFVTQSDAQPSYARDTVLMKGDNMSAVQWVSKRKGGREPRSGALMRLLGRLEVGSGWCFDALQSLVWRTPSLHDESRRISTVTSARSGPTLLGTDRYWGQRASRYASECWGPARPSVSCAVVSPSLYANYYPVLGRFSGVDKGGRVF